MSWELDITFELDLPDNGPSFNCACEDDAQLATLAELRSRIIEQLGFASPEAISTKTLGALRTYLLRRLGFAAQAANPPPGMNDLLTEFINEAQDMLWRLGYGDQTTVPTAMSSENDECTLDAMGIQLLALANAKSHYGQDAKTIFEQFAAYREKRPPGLKQIVDGCLRMAQEQLYRRYEALRTERFYKWTMTPGQRFYAIRGNEDSCPVKLDPQKVTWVGIQDPNGMWLPLIEGIPPVLYTTVDQPGTPTRYEIRSCIEVFPAPDKPYILRVKGHFGLLPFSSDSDQTTLDSELVYLWAVGLAKQHYRQPDAETYFAQARAHMGSLVAGGHHTARYVPGARELVPMPKPIFLPLLEDD